jgi:lysophospholipase L1-like esterase
MKRIHTLFSLGLSLCMMSGLSSLSGLISFCSAEKGAVAEAKAYRIPTSLTDPAVVNASGTQPMSVSNQITTPDGQPPVVLSHFTKEKPASRKPVLRWEKVQGAVVYEVQLAQNQRIFLTDDEIFINGYNAVLPPSFTGEQFEWRVRALNLERQPLSPFSAWQKVYVDMRIPVLQRPVPMNEFNKGNGTTLLYPVYNWIPVNGAKTYEVEILNSLPQRADAPAPPSQLIGRGKSTGFDWYDDHKRVSTSPMYWRVRGLDGRGNPVGLFSDPQRMATNPDDHWLVGTLGDSIYHGGGSLSYSPSDWEYSFQHFLKFDSINLAQSGDTSEATVARFDEDVLPFHPQYLLIMTGTNSLRAGTDSDEVINDLKTLKEKCRNNGIYPVFMTLPPINPANIKRAFNESTVTDWKDRFAAVNAWIRQQVHVDLAGKIDESQELPMVYGLDGIHLDTAGKKLMAEAVNEQWDAILRQLAKGN